MDCEQKGRGIAVRRIIFEMLLILSLSLLLALVYNGISPNGLKILPKKNAVEKAVHGENLKGGSVLQVIRFVCHEINNLNIVRA